MPALQAGQPAGLMRGFAPGRHCVTAFCGLRPLVLQGEVSPCEPLWPASQLYPRLPNPIEHTRPRGIHAPTRSFGIIQTMLLALPNVGLERMGREKPQQFERILAACGRMFSFLVFACVARPRKPFRLSRWGLFRPIRSGPPLEKTVAMPGGMPGKDRGTGCTLRSVGVSGFFQQGSAGTRAREDCKENLLLTLGRRGGAPHKPSRSDG